MSKILLFVCLALFGASVYGQTQIRLVNAWYDSSITIGLVASLTNPINSTSPIPKIVGASDGAPPNVRLTIPVSDYQQLPADAFVADQPLRISAIDVEDLFLPYTEKAFLDSFTIAEGQSYSFVYLATSDFDSTPPFVSIDNTLLAFEELPSTPIYGKAFVRIVNVAVSTFSPLTNMNVTLNGTGVAAQEVSIPFGEASDFLVYDSAVELTLFTTLRVEEPIDVTSLTRSLTFTPAVDKATVIYIRGDIGDGRQYGMALTAVDFPPAPPSADTPAAAPMATTPMAAETPVAVPVASAPQAPVAAPVRAPVKRVSSAAQTVAQIAGVAGLVSLLF
eukprot:TRINITY_DN484_c0_g1_i1.p1 TRINITY_DN484_c0_g1~~TRINITY_DN484_c0_g1_i1.p1  ORF type:complete len:334 (-),score=44.09 TRINITY_DN484_c0_g1_i1:81-1082(-)